LSLYCVDFYIAKPARHCTNFMIDGLIDWFLLLHLKIQWFINCLIVLDRYWDCLFSDGAMGWYSELLCI